MNEADSLAGRLLLALPGMGDPRFARATIAMFVHNAQGAFGLDLGSLRSDVRFRDVLEELDIESADAPDCPVLHGGPVETGRGFVIHSRDWMSEATLDVPALAAVTASPAILTAIANGTGPRQWLFALGYAGWGPGQLDDEMHRHGWHAAAGNSQILFDTPPEHRWEAAWRAEGIDPSLLASETGHA
jgi:putative transcriptional regulator